MRENKARIIFWFIVFIIFVSISFYGYKLYNSGYGKYGKVKQILSPIALEFNTLDDVRRLTDITAAVKKDKLVITYVNASGKKEYYKFDYIKDGNVEYIKNIDNNKTSTWNFIVLQMINAIYHYNGGKDSVFDYYLIDTFKSTTINDGIIYDESNRIITLNINSNIVKNISGKIPTLKEDKFIKDEDIVGIKDILNNDKKYHISKYDINIYIKQTDKTYEIYSSIKEDNQLRVHKSIANVIKALNTNVYQSLNINENGLIDTSETNAYSISYNVLFSESNIFEINDSITLITINK